MCFRRVIGGISLLLDVHGGEMMEGRRYIYIYIYIGLRMGSWLETSWVMFIGIGFRLKD